MFEVLVIVLENVGFVDRGYYDDATRSGYDGALLSVRPAEAGGDAPSVPLSRSLLHTSPGWTPPTRCSDRRQLRPCTVNLLVDPPVRAVETFLKANFGLPTQDSR